MNEKGCVNRDPASGSRAYRVISHVEIDSTSFALSQIAVVLTFSSPICPCASSSSCLVRFSRLSDFFLSRLEQALKHAFHKQPIDALPCRLLSRFLVQLFAGSAFPPCQPSRPVPKYVKSPIPAPSIVTEADSVSPPFPLLTTLIHPPSSDHPPVMLLSSLPAPPMSSPPAVSLTPPLDIMHRCWAVRGPLSLTGSPPGSVGTPPAHRLWPFPEGRAAWGLNPSCCL